MGSVTTSHDMGLHEEQLTGRTQQMFFSASEEENFTYPWAYEVDFDKAAEFDAADMEITEINLQIRELMKSGHGTITVNNPRAKHSLGVGILNRLEPELRRQSRLLRLWADRWRQCAHFGSRRLVLCGKHDGGPGGYRKERGFVVRRRDSRW